MVLQSIKMIGPTVWPFLVDIIMLVSRRMMTSFAYLISTLVWIKVCIHLKMLSQKYPSSPFLILTSSLTLFIILGHGCVCGLFCLIPPLPRQYFFPLVWPHSPGKNKSARGRAAFWHIFKLLLIMVQQDFFFLISKLDFFSCKDVTFCINLFTSKNQIFNVGALLLHEQVTFASLWSS